MFPAKNSQSRSVAVSEAQIRQLSLWEPASHEVITIIVMIIISMLISMVIMITIIIMVMMTTTIIIKMISLQKHSTSTSEALSDINTS